jgi:hypothetical protein
MVGLRIVDYPVPADDGIAFDKSEAKDCISLHRYGWATGYRQPWWLEVGTGERVKIGERDSVIGLMSTNDDTKPL